MSVGGPLPPPRPLRVAIVYDAVYPYVKGGAERRYYELARRLAELGHDVHWYGMRYWDGPAVRRMGGITYHGVCQPRPLYTPTGRRSISQALIYGLACLRLIFARYDVIDCCGFPYFSLFTARLTVAVRGGTLISTWHEVWGGHYWRHYLGRLGRIGHAVELLAARLPQRVLAVSQTTATRLHTDLRRPHRVEILPNGVDVAMVQATDGSDAVDAVAAVEAAGVAGRVGITERGDTVHAEAELSQGGSGEPGFGDAAETAVHGACDVSVEGGEATDHSADVVYAGRLVDFKDVEMLLRALPTMLAGNPDLTCVVIGDGPHRPVLEELAVSLGVDHAVRFPGFLPDERAVYAAMRNSGVFVLPSTREGFGIVVLEANAAGMPVVVVDHPNNSADELIDGTNGVIVPPDPEQLAATVTGLLDESDEEQRAACRASAAEYDWATLALGYERALQEARP